MKNKLCVGMALTLVILAILPSMGPAFEGVIQVGAAADDAPSAAFWILCNQATEAAVEALTESSFTVTNETTSNIAFGSTWDLFPNDAVNSTSTNYINVLFDKDQYTVHFRVTMYTLSNSPYTGNVFAHYQNDNSTFVWKIVQTNSSHLTITVENGGSDSTDDVAYTNNTAYDMMVTVNETTADLFWFVDGANSSTAALAGNLAPDDNSQLILGDMSATSNVSSKCRFHYLGYDTVYSDDETTETASFFENMVAVGDWTLDNTSADVLTVNGNTVTFNDNVTTTKASMYKTFNDSDYTLYARIRVLSDQTGDSHTVNATSTPYCLKHEVTGGQDAVLWAIRVKDENEWYVETDTYGSASQTALTGFVFNQSSAYGWYHFKIEVSSALGLNLGHTTTVRFWYGSSTGTWTSIANKTSYLAVNYDSILTVGSDETSADILSMECAWLSVGLTDQVNITMSDDKTGHQNPSTNVEFTVTGYYHYDGTAVTTGYLNGAAVAPTVDINCQNAGAVSVPSGDHDVDLTSGTGTFIENMAGESLATYTFVDNSMLDDTFGWLTTSQDPDHTQQWASFSGNEGRPGQQDDGNPLELTIGGGDNPIVIPVDIIIIGMLGFGVFLSGEHFMRNPKARKDSLISQIGKRLGKALKMGK